MSCDEPSNRIQDRCLLKSTSQNHLFTNNLFQNLPIELPEEIFETILQTPEIKIERILSKGHRSEPEFWYDQAQSEWVLVLQGHAHLELPEGIVELKPGDYFNIPAHQKHRVAWTDPDVETIWLAIFY